MSCSGKLFELFSSLVVISVCHDSSRFSFPVAKVDSVVVSPDNVTTSGA